MRTIPVLALFLALCNTGCKKDEPVPVPVEGGGANTGGTLQMGLGTNMIIQDLTDTLTIPFNGEITEDLDLDNDGTVDIKFHGAITFSQGSGLREYAWLQALRPEVRIATQIVTDTTFLRIDTVGSNIQMHYSCERTGANYTVTSIHPGMEKIKVFEEGNELTSDDVFSPDSVNLRQPDVSSPAPSNQGGYHVSWDANNDCYLFPKDAVRYVGIAITRPDGTLRMGWVKLEYTSNPRHYVFHNTAIQQ